MCSRDADHKRNKHLQKNKHDTVQLLFFFVSVSKRDSGKNQNTSLWTFIGKKAKAIKLLPGTVVDSDD